MAMKTAEDLNLPEEIRSVLEQVRLTKDAATEVQKAHDAAEQEMRKQMQRALQQLPSYAAKEAAKHVAKRAEEQLDTLCANVVRPGTVWRRGNDGDTFLVIPWEKRSTEDKRRNYDVRNAKRDGSVILQLLSVTSKGDGSGYAPDDPRNLAVRLGATQKVADPVEMVVGVETWDYTRDTSQYNVIWQQLTYESCATRPRDLKILQAAQRFYVRMLMENGGRNRQQDEE